MSDITIEKGVAIPDNRQWRCRKYPWREMEIGDSFLVPDSDIETRRKIVSAASYFWLRNPPFKASLRKVEGGVRVWRVA